MDNPSPIIYSTPSHITTLDIEPDLIDIHEEIYHIIGSISDPEHPYTLIQLNIITEQSIKLKKLYLNNKINNYILLITIEFTPTVPHCSLTSLIGLSIYTKLSKYFPDAKIDLILKPGSHNTEYEINKQINDKERIAAALDNPNLYPLVMKLIAEPE